jgi:hypothetical protein
VGGSEVVAEAVFYENWPVKMDGLQDFVFCLTLGRNLAKTRGAAMALLQVDGC